MQSDALDADELDADEIALRRQRASVAAPIWKARIVHRTFVLMLLGVVLCVSPACTKAEPEIDAIGNNPDPSGTVTETAETKKETVEEDATISTAESGSSLSPLHSQLIGLWTVDQSEMVRQMEASAQFQNSDESTRQMMLGLIQNSEIEFEFTKDTVEYRMAGQQLGGTATPQGEKSQYTIVQSKKNTLVLESIDQRGRRDSVTVTINGDKLLISAEGQSFDLVRKK